MTVQTDGRLIWNTATGIAVIRAMNVQGVVSCLHVKTRGTPRRVTSQRNTSVRVAVSRPSFKFATLNHKKHITQCPVHSSVHVGLVLNNTVENIVTY